jgi:hypothetical protein
MRIVSAVAVAAAIFGVAPAVSVTLVNAFSSDQSVSSTTDVNAAPARSRAGR